MTEEIVIRVIAGLLLFIGMFYGVIRLMNKRYHDGWIQGYADGGRDVIEVQRIWAEYGKEEANAD